MTTIIGPDVEPQPVLDRTLEPLTVLRIVDHPRHPSQRGWRPAEDLPHYPVTVREESP